MSKPVIFAVDDDPQVLAAVRRDLRARYRADYTVMGANSGAQALETIGELRARGEALAMVISDQRMPGMPGVELLARSRDAYPLARRLLLTAYADLDAAVKGINEAHLDHYLSKPWDPPEETLYPVVDDLLDAWQVERLPEAAGLRLVGHQWSPRSHAIKDFLAGSLIPYRWVDVERDPEARPLLEAAHIAPEDLPAVVLEDGSVLRNPAPADVAAALGRPRDAAHEMYDLVIVGAGPAGLGAAVYGASEGLRTLLLDRHAPGGQAGTSSRIENYLGFPAGVSGAELTRRAVAQAGRLGAEFLAPVEVAGLTLDAGYKRLTITGGREVVCRAVVIATGMAYREHPAAGMAEHAGAGVYYGTALTEAHAVKGGRVLVLGGGNSAGQGAMYLSRHAREVDLVIRRDSLQETMSQYLIDQIGATANVRVRTRTVLEAVAGTGRLERVVLRSLEDDSSVEEPADAVFVCIGTRPYTAWLPDTVLRDGKGFILTGRDLSLDEGFLRLWKERRDPLPLETSIPGVFAAGDVRAGAMNRVAAAVAEGSMAIKLVHGYLALT